MNCEYCDKYNIHNYNHNTKEHICFICGEINAHHEFEHSTCKYCTKYHITSEHVCSVCNLKGHTKNHHICKLCNGTHETKEHKCSVCYVVGHEKKIKDHNICSLCDDYKRYQHNTEEHLKYVGLKNTSKEIKKNFKFCSYCNNISFIIDNKCIVCDKKIFTEISCNKCDYKWENSYLNFCGYCGNKIDNLCN